MDVERLKQIIVDQRAQLEEKFKKEKIIDRDSSEIRKLFSHPNAFIILGIRRCGKSTLSEEIFRNQKFGYVNFDDDRMIKLDASDLNRVLQALYELYGSDLENIVLDEIQEVYGWEKFVSRLRDTKKVIVTGSNSMLLSGELATSLTGRHLDFTLFPFSFKEYLEYKGIKYSGVLTTAEMSKLNSALHRYLIEGGFPEVLKFGESFLKSIYNDIITKDVIKRHKIKNEGDLKEIASFLLSNISKEFSYSSI
ncbi:MAG: ATP-binding protein, partial [Candidatus Parvarchaeum sp.]|nr:ATP-binding protein [Candidatus Parvarchaeum tengchongense]